MGLFYLESSKGKGAKSSTDQVDLPRILQLTDSVDFRVVIVKGAPLISTQSPCLTAYPVNVTTQRELN